LLDINTKSYVYGRGFLARWTVDLFTTAFTDNRINLYVVTEQY